MLRGGGPPRLAAVLTPRRCRGHAGDARAAAHALAPSRRTGHLQPSLQGIGTGTQRDVSPRENRQALRDSWARSGARAGAGDCGTRAHGLYLAYFFQRARLSSSGAEAYMLPHMS